MRKLNRLIQQGVIAQTVIAGLAFALLACAPKTLPFPAGKEMGSATPYRIGADPEKGFHSPYFLMIPPGTGLRNRAVPLLVYPNNSGKTDDRAAFHEGRAIERAESHQGFAKALDAVLLIPGFPRPRAHRLVYTHALDRDTFTVGDPRLSRPDLQLLAMIADARERLGRTGVRTREKVLMAGFSAAGMFAGRFTLLHPEHVLAAAVGSPGGWPIVPIAEYRGTPLSYPVGTADLPALSGQHIDIETFCAVPKFFFMGREDTNDSVPYSDSYDPSQAETVNRLFGTTPVNRWDDAEAIYRSRNCAADFRLYPGTGHKMSPEMQADAVAFLIKALDDAGKNQDNPI